MHLSDDSIQAVKDAIDIGELIGSYVDLKAQGKSMKGLCPFHSEKTPSFVVTPELGIYKCFGCGEAGDGISFIMKMEGLDFMGAVRFLADRYGIPLEEARPFDDEKRKRKKKLYELNREAALFYYKQLLIGKEAQAYLMKRSYNASIINPFLLGYADGKGDSLYKYLKERGYEEEDMLHLGLIASSRSGRGYYDKFRRRLIFPIISNKNKIIGFGGRVIGDGKPKYLNSPESDIFHKGKNLYGIHIVTKKNKHEKILMVEGYMDVIGLYAHGIDYALASLGTSLTVDQAKLIKRYSENIYLCYDGDSAGIKASRRAVDIFKEVGIVPKMILLPDNMDPDDYAKKFGKEEFENRIDEALDPPEFELRLIETGYNLGVDKDRLDFLKEAIKFLAGLDSDSEREIYIEKVALKAGVSPESLKGDVGKEIEFQDKERHEKKTWVRNDASFPDPYGYYDDIEEDDYGDDYYPIEDEDYADIESEREEERAVRERKQLENAIILRLAKAKINQKRLDFLLDFLSDDQYKELALIMVSMWESGIAPAASLLREKKPGPGTDKIFALIEDAEKNPKQDRDLLENQEIELCIKAERTLLSEDRAKMRQLIKLGDEKLSQLGKDRSQILQDLLELEAKLRSNRGGGHDGW